MSQQRLQDLLDKLLNNDCTAAEKQELFQLIETVNDEPQLQDVLEGAWMRYNQPSELVAEERSATILKNILNENKVVPLHKKRKLWPYIAAASVVILIGLGIYRLSLPTSKGPVKPDIAAITNDVKAPDKSKATITLANGKEVLLEEAENDSLAGETGLKVVKQADGQLAYEIKQTDANAPVTSNRLTNPRGSRVISLTLPDGSRVWLNAGSTLIYPTAFKGMERSVGLTGEAYFEVKKLAAANDDKVPFVVQVNVPVNNAKVTVLGTHFNIKAYEDEANTKVTLLEGKVVVSADKERKPEVGTVTLKPGEQAAVTNSPLTIDHSPLTIDHSPNIEQVMAWKDGLFNYKSSDITEVLRDAARWYDIDIVYEGAKPTDTFTGGIDRTATLTELLTILQMTGVRFKLEGRKLIVLSGK